MEELNSLLNKWLAIQGMPQRASIITKGISAGVYISLLDALEKSDDKEIVDILKQMRTDNSNKSMQDLAETELEEEFQQIKPIRATSPVTPTQPRKPASIADKQSSTNLGKDLERSVKSKRRTTLAVDQGDGESVEAELADVEIDQLDPTNSKVAIRRKDNPNKIEIVPISQTTILEAWDRQAKKLLSESKVVKSRYGHDIIVSNEEYSIIRKLNETAFVPVSDLSDRQNVVATAMTKRGILSRVKSDDKVGYKMSWGEK